MNSFIKSWLSAFRLRTLPLAISSIAMGGFLAASVNSFRWDIFVFSVITTVFLQILSNLANDYGDFANGADGAERVGPLRAVHSGMISPQAMKVAILIFVLLSLISGIYLLLLSFKINKEFLLFLLLGLLSIVAAIKYTAGKKPYGYSGLGDLAVFLFFGILGVAGSFYLYTSHLPLFILLPSCACGFFSAAVLNINNIRDIQSDSKTGKNTIPVKIGLEKARIYHLFLLSAGVILAILYVVFNYQEIRQLLFLVVLPLFFFNGFKIFTTQPAKLDPYLKQMALTTLIFVITFGLGIL